MSADPTPTTLAREAGISVPYASQILKGSRTPARALAIHIFRVTGWSHPIIASLSGEEIGLLEKIDPWSPRQEAA